MFLVILESVAECALCQDIESNIYKKVGDTKDPEEIEAIISRVCKFIPAIYEHKVNNFFPKQ